MLALIKGSRLRRRCAPLTRTARAAALVLSTGEERSAGSRGEVRGLRTPGRRPLAPVTGAEGPSGFDGHGRAAVRSASMVRPGSARAAPSHRPPGCPFSPPAVALGGANAGPGGEGSASTESAEEARGARRPDSDEAFPGARGRCSSRCRGRRWWFGHRPPARPASRCPPWASLLAAPS